MPTNKQELHSPQLRARLPAAGPTGGLFAIWRCFPRRQDCSVVPARLSLGQRAFWRSIRLRAELRCRCCPPEPVPAVIERRKVGPDLWLRGPAVPFQHNESSALVGEPTESFECNEAVTTDHHDTAQSVAHAGEPDLAALRADAILDFEMAGLHPHATPKPCIVSTPVLLMGDLREDSGWGKFSEAAMEYTSLVVRACRLR